MIYYMGGFLNQYKNIIEANAVNGSFLETFYGIRGKTRDEKMQKILSNCNKIIIDSGAFTFMNSKRDTTEAEMDDYFKEYCNFIEKYKNEPKIEGFFEMDIDALFGVEKALYYQAKLKEITDKIIPVWHFPRGVNEFHKMCKENKKVAITLAHSFDVKDEQINYFINTAHHYGAKIHLLGFTRFHMLENLNLEKGDSFDSVSYIMNGVFGKIKLINHKKKAFDLSFEGLREFKHLHPLNLFLNYKISQSLLEEGE